MGNRCGNMEHWAGFGGLAAERKPFQKEGTPRVYAPDKQADILHVRLALEFDFKARAIAGTCRTTLRGLAGGTRDLRFDAVDLDIQSCERAGKKLTFSNDRRELRVRLDRALREGEEATVAIRYRATPRVGLYFVAPDKEYPGKHLQVWSQGQDEDSRYYFPCYDHPNEKATSEMILTVPRGMTAISNGRLLSRKVKGKNEVFHWRCDTPHPAYLMSLAVGPFVEFRDTWKDVPLTFYTLPDRKADAMRSFAKTKSCMEFFSSRIGVDYPYEKYAQCVVEDFVFGGMENISATTLTDMTLHDERAHQDYRSEPLVAHELAHQWWGDLLTCRDWSHAWLNEGFATYFEALFEEHDLGADEFIYYMHNLRRNYLAEDSDAYRRPIVTRIFSEPIDLFDRHLYEKGGWVLHMLRNWLGDELWWKAIGHYCRTNRNRNVRTEDLILAFEETTGRNLEKFMDQWVFGAGHPELKVSYSWDDSQRLAVVSLEQGQKIEGDTHLFTEPGIEIHFVPEKGRTQVQVLRMSSPRQVFHVPLAAAPRMVLVDPAYKVLRTMDLKLPRPMLLAILADAPFVMARAEAAHALAKDPVPETLEALKKALLNDRFWGVRAEVAGALARAGGPAARTILMDAVARVKHPKARRAVVRALGEFRDGDVAALLEKTLKGDASYFVAAEAAQSLGRTRREEARRTLLKSGLSMESHNDVIRATALRALAEFKADKPEDLEKVFLEWVRRGKPPAARVAAVNSLLKVAADKDTVRQRVTELLEETDFRFKNGLYAALGEHGNAKYLGPLGAAVDRELDGRLKRRGRESAEEIRSRESSTSELERLRDEMRQLRESGQGVRERLDKLEAKGKRK